MTTEIGATSEMATRALLSWEEWQPDASVVLGYAPGRLDVLGGIADYSGATVLQMPLAVGIFVAIQPAADRRLVAMTGGPATHTLPTPRVEVPLEVVSSGPPEEAPERLRQALLERGAPWAAYLLGPLALLRATGQLPEVSGLRIAVWSNVPLGAGVSSSAALEVASLRALFGVLERAEEPLALARIAQQAEHRVAQAPCGIMDQAVATFGRRDHLLILRCQPADVVGYQPLPRDVVLCGLDSGIAHHIGGEQYGRVRCATFMGRAIIATLSGSDRDPPGGYLCNLSADGFLNRYAPLLPLELRGADFLAQYGETGDDATHVEPETLYRVRDCATHPVLEQANVVAFLDALRGYGQTGAHEALNEAGAAMYRSHASYGTRCGLGTPETDLIVDLVRERGAAAGLYGAKITGGGAGGTVAILAAGSQARDEIGRIAAVYSQRTGRPARIIAGSGNGALETPIIRAQPRTPRGGAHAAE
jgi:L-arabinokinase